MDPGPLGRSISKRKAILNLSSNEETVVKTLEASVNATLREGTSKPKKQLVLQIRVEPDQFVYIINKQRHSPKSVSIPFVLLWINDVGDLSVELIGPEQTLVLSCEDQAQKTAFLSIVNKRVETAVTRFKAGDLFLRSNGYAFSISAKNWEYEGHWKLGNMFGVGRLGFKSGTPQQITYNGYFNSLQGIGIGTKVVQKTKSFKDIGWEFSNPFDGDIKEFVFKPVTGLWPDDIEDLKKKGHIKQLEKGNTLHVVGAPAEDDLCLIKSGTIRLTRKRFAIDLGQGEFFGSVMTVLGKKACYNIKATEDAEIYRISLHHLEKDHSDNSYALLHRFYYQTALLLANRWTELSNLSARGPVSTLSKNRSEFFFRNSKAMVAERPKTNPIPIETNTHPHSQSPKTSDGESPARPTHSPAERDPPHNFPKTALSESKTGLSEAPSRKKFLGSRPLKDAHKEPDQTKKDSITHPNLDRTDSRKTRDSDYDFDRTEKSSSSEKLVPLPHRSRASHSRSGNETDSHHERSGSSDKSVQIPKPDKPLERAPTRKELALKDPPPLPTINPQTPPHIDGKATRSMSEPNIHATLTGPGFRTGSMKANGPPADLRLKLPPREELPPPTVTTPSPPQETESQHPDEKKNRTPMKALTRLLGGSSTTPSPRTGQQQQQDKEMISPREGFVFRKSFALGEGMSIIDSLADESSHSFQQADRKLAQAFGFDEQTVFLKRVCSGFLLRSPISGHPVQLGISTNTSLRNDFLGIFYLTTNHLCFMAEEDEKKEKALLVLPISVLSDHPIRHKQREIHCRVNKKSSQDMTLPCRVNAQQFKLSIVFSSTQESLAISEILSCLLEQQPQNDASATEYANAVFESFTKRVVDIELLSSPPNYPIIKPRERPIRLWGPGSNSDLPESKKGFFQRKLDDHLAVTITTTYPRDWIVTDGKLGLREDRRLGDPMCDQFCVERYQNQTIFAVADGCNWGEKVARAAEAVSKAFVEWVRQCMWRSDKIHSTADLFNIFVEGFALAQSAILAGNAGWDFCGTSTLLGGALCQIEHPSAKWGLLLLNLGDCKAYKISTRSNDPLVPFLVQDLTLGSRRNSALFSCNDCGGRLGSTNNNNMPDLRNLEAYFALVEEGDFILTCSDGLYDNLDPQSLGLDLSQVGYPHPVESWADLDSKPETLQLVADIKHKYTVQKIVEILNTWAIKENKSPSKMEPVDIRDALIAYSIETTTACRTFMESDHNNPQPPQTKQYPGKPDHVTCLVLRVGNSDDLISAQDQILQETKRSLNDPISGLNKDYHLIEGSELVKWLETHEQHKFPGLRTDEIGQRLLDFEFISPVTNTAKTFNPSLMYTLETDSLMTQADWQMLEVGSRVRKFKNLDTITTIVTQQPKPQVWRLRKGTCKLILISGETRICNAPEIFVTFGKLVGTSVHVNSIIGHSEEIEFGEYDPEFLDTVFVKHPEIAKRFYSFICSALTSIIVDILNSC